VRVAFGVGETANNSGAQLQGGGDRSLQQIKSWVLGQRTNVTYWATQPHLLAAPIRSAMGVAMADIKTSIDGIAKIIKTIDEIAFQTNILARTRRRPLRRGSRQRKCFLENLNDRARWW
jgi:hypothetical protein